MCSRNGSSVLLQTISNSSACENVRTVPAKINDVDGLGMGRVYFCKRFQIAQLVKIQGPSQLKSNISMVVEWVKLTVANDFKEVIS